MAQKTRGRPPIPFVFTKQYAKGIYRKRRKLARGRPGGNLYVDGEYWVNKASLSRSADFLQEKMLAAGTPLSRKEAVLEVLKKKLKRFGKENLAESLWDAACRADRKTRKQGND